MEIESVKAQCGATAQLVSERIERLLAFIRIRISKVNQVAVMRQDLCWRVTTLLAVAAESLNLGWFKVLGGPLPLVLGEKGKGCGLYGVGVKWRILHTATRTDVRSYILHNLIPLNNGTMITLFAQTTKSIATTSKPNVDTDTNESREQ